VGKQGLHLCIIMGLLSLHLCGDLHHLVLKVVLACCKLLMEVLEICSHFIGEGTEHLVQVFDFILEQLEVMLDELLDFHVDHI